MAATESFVLLTEIRLSSIIIFIFYTCFDYVVSNIARFIMVVYSSSFYSCGHDYAVDICACNSKGMYVRVQKMNNRSWCTGGGGQRDRRSTEGATYSGGREHWREVLRHAGSSTPGMHLRIGWGVSALVYARSAEARAGGGLIAGRAGPSTWLLPACGLRICCARACQR